MYGGNAETKRDGAVCVFVCVSCVLRAVALSGRHNSKCFLTLPTFEIITSMIRTVRSVLRAVVALCVRHNSKCFL